MSAEETSLTELQRWAREQGMPLAPNALRALRAENIETAEQAAVVPDSVLLSIPWVKESSVRAIRTWQEGKGIPVTPDPEPLPEPEVPRPSMLVKSAGLVWPPQDELTRVAWETYMALLKPGDGVIARPGASEALRQAWSAAEAWLREKRASAERVAAEIAADSPTRGSSHETPGRVGPDRG